MNSESHHFESQMSRMTNGEGSMSGNNNDYLAQRLAAMGISTESLEIENDESDLELRDISEDSDSEYEDEVEQQGEEDSSVASPHRHHGQQLTGTAANNGMELIPLEGEEEIDSDEERDLLKEIREEIQNKVKEEMKDEIKMYQAKIDAIEQGNLPGDEERKEKKEEEGNLDPKIQEALVKMRKLDRILMKKLRKEKEVKRDRILLERRIREEIQNIKPEGREHKDVKCNTDKFVLLALPPSHNEGVPVEDIPATPVFQTQLNETDFQEMNEKLNGQNREGSCTDRMSKSSASMASGDNSSQTTEGERKRKKKRKKDFIKRNKELAANADEMIAMTDEERKRVGDLLNDLDSMPELPEEMDSISGDSSNPFQMLPVQPGEGYRGDETEIRSMVSIDHRLRELMPEDDYNNLVTPQESEREPQHKLFTRVDIRSVGDIERYGEKALIESKEQREMQARLQKIEEQLAKFNNPNEIEIETPCMSEYQMKGLIDQCVRSLSRSSYADSVSVTESTPRSEVSSIVSVENPPHLPEEVLQKLLAEAHFPLSSKLEALQEEDQEEDDEDTEPSQSQSQQIRAETWKLIAESDVFENGRSADLDLESISRTSSQSTLRGSGFFDKQNSNVSRLSYEEEGEDDSRLVLPEISQSPFLVTQGLNNQLSKNESYHKRSNDSYTNSRDSIHIIRNTLSDSVSDVPTDNNGVMTPRPPSSDRRSNSELLRSRSITPMSQT